MTNDKARDKVHAETRHEPRSSAGCGGDGNGRDAGGSGCSTAVACKTCIRVRALMIAGILAPIVYVAAALVGGWLTSGYSHLARPVSDLVATGAEGKAFLDPLFAVYNILIFLFALGLFGLVRTESERGRHSAGVVAAFALMAVAALGFATLFFPWSAPGAPATPADVTHITLSGLGSLGAMLAILFAGLWFQIALKKRSYSFYSLVTVTAVVLLGAASLADPFSVPDGALQGLGERLTMLAFLQWVFVMAIAVWRGQLGAKR